MSLGSLRGTSLEGNCFSGSSLAGDTLGARVYRLEPLGGVSIDPIRAYGEKSAAWIMSSIRQLPAEDRRAALRALFERVDPSLWVTVEAQAAKFKAEGRTAPAALERAIAVAMSAGILGELTEVGERAMRGDRAPVPRQSLLGLGAYPDDVHSLDGIWSSVKGVVQDVMTGASKAANFAKDGASKLGKLACEAVNNPVAQQAAMVDPRAAAGAVVAQAVCPKPKPPAPPPPPPPPPSSSKLPSWVLPVGIVGGGLVLVLALRR